MESRPRFPVIKVMLGVQFREHPPPPSSTPLLSGVGWGGGGGGGKANNSINFSRVGDQGSKPLATPEGHKD